MRTNRKSILVSSDRKTLDSEKPRREERSIQFELEPLAPQHPQPRSLSYDDSQKRELLTRIHMDGYNPIIPSIMQGIDDHNQNKLSAYFKNKLYPSAALPQNLVYKGVRKEMEKNARTGGAQQMAQSGFKEAAASMLSFQTPYAMARASRQSKMEQSIQMKEDKAAWGGSSMTMESRDQVLSLSQANQSQKEEAPSTLRTFRIREGSPVSAKISGKKLVQMPEVGKTALPLRVNEGIKSMENAYKVIRQLKGPINISQDVFSQIKESFVGNQFQSFSRKPIESTVKESPKNLQERSVIMENTARASVLNFQTKNSLFDSQMKATMGSTFRGEASPKKTKNEAFQGIMETFLEENEEEIESPKAERIKNQNEENVLTQVSFGKKSEEEKIIQNAVNTAKLADETMIDKRNIEAFIEMVKNKKVSSSEFIYLIKKDQFDSYNLKPCNFSVLQKEKATCYFTLSTKGLTKYNKNSPVEHLSIGEWVKERNNFNQLKKMPFFKKFRGFQMLQKWKQCIRQFKREQYKGQLEKKLFLTDIKYQDALLNHMDYCHAIRSLHLIHFREEKTKNQKPDSFPTIDEFNKKQEHSRAALKKKLQNYSSLMHKNNTVNIRVRMDEIKQTIFHQISSEEMANNAHNIVSSKPPILLGDDNPKKTSCSVLGLPENLSFGQRTILREEIMNFLRFAYLLDFTTTMALADIYIESAKEVLETLSLMETTMNFEILFEAHSKKLREEENERQNAEKYDLLGNKGQGKKKKKKIPKIQQVYGKAFPDKSPWFFINLVFQPSIRVSPNLIWSKELPVNIEDPEDFDFNMNCFFEEEQDAEAVIEKIKEDFANRRKKPTMTDLREKLAKVESKPDPREFLPREKRYVKSLSKLWVSYSPNIEELNGMFMNWMEKGMRVLNKSMTRWSKNKEYEVYLELLEEYDSMVGENWEEPEHGMFLKPKLWIKSNEIFKRFPKETEKILKNCYKHAETVSEEMETYIQDYWLNTETNLHRLHDPSLKFPFELVKMVSRVFEYQEDRFKREVPYKKSSGVFLINMKTLQDILWPQPQNMRNKLEQLIPEVYQNRIEEINKWSEVALRKVSLPVVTIEDFMEERHETLKVSFSLPYKKNLLLTAELFLSFMVERGIYISKSMTNQFADISGMVLGVSSGLMESDTRAERHSDRFLGELKETIKKLKEESDLLIAEVYNEALLKKSSNPVEMSFLVENLNRKATEIEKIAKETTEHQQFLEEKNPESFEFVAHLRSELDSRLILWRSMKEVQGLQESFMQKNFEMVDLKERKEQVNRLFQSVIRLGKMLPTNDVVMPLRDEITLLKSIMPVIASLRSTALKLTHWTEIAQLLNMKDLVLAETTKSKKSYKNEASNNQGFLAKNLTVQNLIENGGVMKAEEIMAIATRATQEELIQKKLAAMEKEWKRVEVPFTAYRDTKEMYKLGDLDQLLNQVDEGLASINSILANRYIEPFKSQAEEIQHTFLFFQENIEKWKECERKWIYIGSIYATSDLKKSIGEGSLFESADKLMQGLYRKAAVSPQLVKLVKIPHLSENLTKATELFESIEKLLDAYLESKRRTFPRLYFISSEELVSILSQVSLDPEAIKPYLPKLFENIDHIGINPEGRLYSIETMKSVEDEVVPLNNPNLYARGLVEAWLDNFQRVMNDTVLRFIKQSLLQYEIEGQKTKRVRWAKKQYAQAVPIVESVSWVIETENTIARVSSEQHVYADYKRKHIDRLDELANRSSSFGSLTEIQRRVFIGMITLDIHFRDVLDRLAKEECESAEEFVWLKELRFYWSEADNKFQVKQIMNTFNYGNEYQGAAHRLVVTPLTERCWVTITSALGMYFGTLLVGPAGAGKTESVKDLSKSMGNFCILYNCTEQVDSKMLTRLFTGLLQQGAWICLDEFNRITTEVLSVVAQQLLEIRMALVKGFSECSFDGNILPLKNSIGIFTTMNFDASTKAKKKSKIPSNLLSLFREVSMLSADFTQIAEILLVSQGFKKAKTLAKKLVLWYKLLSEQLSPQSHYDFGMRAIKAVLMTVGKILQEIYDSNASQATIEEEDILIRAMCVSEGPKLLKEDWELFKSLMDDLFPKSEVILKNDAKFQSLVNEVCKAERLALIPKFTEKVIELRDQMRVRLGVMLVGSGGSGKTKIWTTLKSALYDYLSQTDNLEEVIVHLEPINTYIVNPKYMSMGELFGESDKGNQNTWRDGVAGNIFQNVNTLDLWKKREREKHWVIFDGQVDGLWIEPMNSVLDENMTLCLANSERIKMRQEIKVLFEVENLSKATPDVVSRCGMIYVSEETVDWVSIVTNWAQYTLAPKLPEGPRKRLTKYTADLMISTLKICFSGKRFQLAYFLGGEDRYAVELVIKLFNCYLGSNWDNIATEKELEEHGGKKMTYFPGETLDPFDEEPQIEKKLTLLIIFSIVWGYGASVDPAAWEKFDLIIRECFRTSNVEFPSVPTPFDIGISLKGDGEFYPLDKVVPLYIHSESIPYDELFVETLDTFKIKKTVEKLSQFFYPVVMAGQAGIGKTALISQINSNSMKEYSFVHQSISFSSKTPRLQVQEMLDSKLQKKSKNTYGPSPNTKTLLLIDDFHMSSHDIFDSQPLMEFMRMFVEQKGYYDLNKLFFKQVVDVWTMTVVTKDQGAQKVVPSRLLRHFFVLNLSNPNQDKLTSLFSELVAAFFALHKFHSPVFYASEKVSLVVSSVYFKVCEQLKPTPSRFQYYFTIRDVAKTIEGVLRIRPGSIMSETDLARLVAHEILRVFGDRLSDLKDLKWLNEAITATIGQYTQVNLDPNMLNSVHFSYLASLDRKSNQTDQKEGKSKKKVNVYEELKDTTTIKILQAKIEEYNYEFHDEFTGFMLFDEIICHLLRAMRILLVRKGHGLFMGLSGCGKRSTLKIASFICGCQMMRVAAGGSSTREFFLNEIFQVTSQAGLRSTKTTLLITESLLQEDQFMEDLNVLLTTGDLPGLFSKREDFDELVTRMSALCIERDLTPTGKTEDYYNMFLEEVKNNLHIVICSSPIGDTLRTACRKFPFLLSTTMMDWYHEWPKEAMKSMAETIFFEKKFEVTPLIIDALTRTFEQAKEFAREFKLSSGVEVTYTPKSYIDFVKLACQLYSSRMGEKDILIAKLRTGIYKLQNTNKVVGELTSKLEKFLPELKIQSQKAEEYMKVVSAETLKVNEFTNQVEMQMRSVEEQAIVIRALTESAQKEFDIIEPILKEAHKGLNNFPKSELSEIKGYSQPPFIVELVMGAVCTLLGEGKEWAKIKSVIVDPNFILRLKKLDLNAIPPERAQALHEFVLKPQFDPVYVGNRSTSSKAICVFCRAVDKYINVRNEAEPKRKKMELLKEKQKIKNKELDEKLAELSVVKEKLAKLQAECDIAEQKRKALEDELNITKIRVSRGMAFQDLLREEGDRWADQVEQLTRKAKAMNGDILFSGLAISYSSSYPQVQRERLLQKFKEELVKNGINVSENFSLNGFLYDKGEANKWVSHGLPSDSASKDNASIVLTSNKWPLIIDPQNQAIRWLEKHYSVRQKLFIESMNDRTIGKKVEIAVESGFAFIMTNIEKNVPSYLEPIIQRQIFEYDGRNVIRLNQMLVNYHEEFRFVLLTKMTDSSYPPEVSTEVTVVNFSITFEGLKSQLLGLVIKNEDPQLEVQREGLVQEISSMFSSLNNQQTIILNTLADYTGFILDDEELLNTLANSKKSSITIKEKLMSSSSVERVVEMKRQQFTDVAIFGVAIFFVIKELAALNEVYQFSLEFFFEWFSQSVKETEKFPEESKQDRILRLKNSITGKVYKEVSCGLTAFDQKQFGFSLAIITLQLKGEFSEDLWELLLKNPKETSDSTKPQEVSPHPKILSNGVWSYVLKMSMKEQKDLSRLDTDLKHHIEDWHEYLGSTTPWKRELLPTRYRHIKPFSLYLMTRAFHNHLSFDAVPTFLNEVLGSYVHFDSIMTLRDVWGKLAKDKPLVVMLSQGFNLVGELMQIIQERSLKMPVYPLSLGQGNKKRADQIIKYAMVKGGLVILQNCHLAKKWMKTLDSKMLMLRAGELTIAEFEKTLIKKSHSIEHASIGNHYYLRPDLIPQSVMNPEHKCTVKISDDFRLVLTTASNSTDIPMDVLNGSYKLTTEAPKGIKANMGIFFAETSKITGKNPKIECYWKRMLYSACMYHSVLHERLKFGPVGFSKPYDFNQSDLEVCTSFLKSFWDSCEELYDFPFESLKFLAGETTYGSRVADERDRKILIQNLKLFLSIDSCTKTDNSFHFMGTEKYTIPKVNAKNWAKESNSELIQSLENSIGSFPTPDIPEIFGLHINSVILMQRKESQQFIDGLSSNNIMTEFSYRLPAYYTYSLTHFSGGDSEIGFLSTNQDEEYYGAQGLERMSKISFTSPESFEEKTARIIKIFDKQVPPKINPSGVLHFHVKLDENNRRNPLSVFMMQEMQKYNVLLETIKKSFLRITKALGGQSAMTPDLEEITSSMGNGRIPKGWRKYSYETRKPLASWIDDLKAKVEYVKSWLYVEVPETFWLGAFYFPQGFITSLTQYTARLRGIAYDELAFKHRVVENSKNQELLKENYYFKGLFMEGARYDPKDDALAEQIKGKGVVEMPLICFMPIKASDVIRTKDYLCPVYKTMGRTGKITSTGTSENYILSITMKTGRAKAGKWVLRGVAMFSQTDD